MRAAESYADTIDGVAAQRARLGIGRQADRWSGPMAQRFRADPRRKLDANLETIAALVRPEDVLVDVGGGAGRLSLPLALRCREVINVDPSPGMGEQFEASAAEAGIANARLVRSGWLEAGEVEGEVVLAANVTYFVREIVDFIKKLDAAARRLVLVAIASPPPPMMNAKLFRLLHGEEQATVPGQPELLPVLWEMGIMPDVRVLPEPFSGFPEAPPSREEAITSALQTMELENNPDARRRIEEHFAELFGETAEGFRPLWRPTMQQLLITWQPRTAKLRTG